MQQRWYQEEAIDSLFDYFERNRAVPDSNPVVAMPTGTGKSHVIGGFTHQAFMRYPGQRWLMATHVKELVAQNARAFLKTWPAAPLGIYSAGLKQKDTAMPIIFGGVKSMLNNMEAFGRRDLMIIDEGHLVSHKANTGYRTLIKHFKALNPWFRVVMLTATPYRLGQGLLTDGGEHGHNIATDICYDITGLEAFNRLVAEGYIAPLISFTRDVGIDLGAVGMSGGEYNQAAVQHAMDRDDITFRALQQCCEAAWDRRCWLIFASGVQHAENIATMLTRFGVSAAAIHSELDSKERDARIKAYKRGQIRCLVNMNVLTTGFDFPPIDFIGMLRPTLSPGLWVQMLGRGTRPYDPASPGDVDPYIWNTLKHNCLVLDFAANARKLGPINDPKIPRPKGKGAGGLMVKECERCGCDNHISVRFCINCGNEFTFETKIMAEAATAEVMTTDVPQVEWFNVQRAFHMKYITRSKGDAIMKVSYHCEGLHHWEEFVWFGDSKMAGKGKRWWQMRHDSDVPETVDQALPLVSQLRVPTRIKVWTNKKPYPEVLNVEFDQFAAKPPEPPTQEQYPWAPSENILGPTSAPTWAGGFNPNWKEWN